MPLLGIGLVALSLTATSHAATRTVVVGVFDNPPIVQPAGDSDYTGLAVDVLKNIARDQGWDLEFRPAPWESLLRQLDGGDIDLLVGIAHKPDRAKRYDFTNETLVNNYGLVLRRPDMHISSLLDLRDQRVGLMARSIHSREFRHLMGEFGIPFTAVELPSYEAVLEAMDAGDLDAGVVNRVFSILRGPDHQVVATGIVFNPVEVRYAVPKGRNADIVAAIDRALATQKQDPHSDYQQALDRWMGGKRVRQLPDWFPAAAGLAALLVVLLLSSNWLIRRQVGRRTAELSESEARFRQLAENIRDVFWVVSADWQQVHYVSPMVESIWGLTPEYIYRHPQAWLEGLHPADREALVIAMAAKTRDGFTDPVLPEFRVTDPQGRTRWLQARAYPITDAQGRVERIAGLTEDVTERRAAEETIRFMAFHDPLTRLGNRHAFEASLRDIANKIDDGTHALIYMDLDQFKVINDTCGHGAGDQMLQGLSAQLQHAINRPHTLARLGGDEFGLLLEDTSLAEAEAVARQLLDAVQAFRFSWEDKIFTVGASIGLVMLEEQRRPLASLLSAADIACYAAKESGRNRVHLWREDDAMLQQREGEMRWVTRIKGAIESDGFVLHAQPIIPLQQQGGPTHREFLLRMLGEDGELILPASFLGAAERYDLMPALDRWVVSKVLAHLGRNAAADGGIAFINLSGQVLNDDAFASHVLQELQRHAVPRLRICLEITETAAIANLSQATRLIETLRQQGVLFALDDFGTGMSSFSYLKSLPVDFLKIDGFFIKGLLDDHMNPAIVDAITRIGHTAGLKVIAEWVEDEAMLERLRELGIDLAQGYAVGRPAPLD